MKKLLLIALLLCLCGCQNQKKQDISGEDKYLSLIETLKEYSGFSDGSQYYDVTCEMTPIYGGNGGFRYYITIDNPKISIYEMQVLAIEKDVDYTNTMAACSGVFDTRYSMIPNQSNPDDGFVKGIVISGISNKPQTTLYMYVNFYNRDYSKEYTEHIKIDVAYDGVVSE